MDNIGKNKAKIIEYLKNGCKEDFIPLRFGVELEHFVVFKDSKEGVPYLGENGVLQILKELQPFYEECIYSEGYLIGLSREGIALSLEPAAQLEVSISPMENVFDIQCIYDGFYREIMPILERYSYELVTLGYQPASKADDLSLIPKERYRFMDKYFSLMGPIGRRMMRGTASTQVSIDYYSEEDFVKKYRVAYALKDILARMCSNTPMYEGELYEGNTLRDIIWQNTDKQRVDVEPFLSEGKMTFEAYAEFVMHTPVIVNRVDGCDSYDERTIGEIAKERVFKKEEIEHFLSMVFPMIRAKHFLELRFADSMPIEHVLTYVLLIKGLFLDADATENFVFSNEFTNMPLHEQMEHIVKYAESKLSAEENKYVEDNRIW